MQLVEVVSERRGDLPELLVITHRSSQHFGVWSQFHRNYSGLKEGCLSPQMSSPISGSSPLKVASSEGSSSRPCFFSVERYERVMQKA